MNKGLLTKLPQFLLCNLPLIHFLCGQKKPQLSSQRRKVKFRKVSFPHHSSNKSSFTERTNNSFAFSDHQATKTTARANKNRPAGKFPPPSPKKKGTEQTPYCNLGNFSMNEPVFFSPFSFINFNFFRIDMFKLFPF